MSDWYCQVGGSVEGPVTGGRLRELARSGRLTRGDQVRQGHAGEWVSASRCKGLFDEPEAGGDPGSRGAPLASIRSIRDCIAPEEKKKRLGVFAVNLLVWLGLAILVVASMGAVLLFYAGGWVLSRLLAEYNVRKLQAMGTTATDRQFPEVTHALREVCGHFGLAEAPRVIILNAGEMNAFAVKFARKRVLVLLCPMLEGVLDRPAELRFILGHELGHTALDHGFRGSLVLVKPAAFKAARELTCDAVGAAAAGDAEAAKTALKRLAAGNALHARLDEADLAAQAEAIDSGLTGWLLRQYLAYPPIGRRLACVDRFFRAHRG